MCYSKIHATFFMFILEQHPYTRGKWEIYDVVHMVGIFRLLIWNMRWVFSKQHSKKTTTNSVSNIHQNVCAKLKMCQKCKYILMLISRDITWKIYFCSQPHFYDVWKYSYAHLYGSLEIHLIIFKNTLVRWMEFIF